MAVSEDEFRVLIVGGGIAGMASAIALRAPGRRIVVLEQSSLSTEIGATISLQPNASKIVEKSWNLGPVLRAKKSMKDQAFNIYSTDGKRQMHIPLASRAEYGGDRMVYHRYFHPPQIRFLSRPTYSYNAKFSQDLHSVLREAATGEDSSSPPAEVRVSSRVIGCDTKAGIVTLANAETVRADLIIGADGIRSQIRQHVIGRKQGSIPTGLSAYRLMVPTKLLDKEPDFTKIINPRESATTMIMGHDRRLIMGPARAGEVYAIVAMVPDEHMREDTANKSWTSEGNLDKLLQSFDVFPSWATKPFRHSSTLGLWQLRDLDPLETWYKDRTIIIGDASHAMLPTQGQGASQSIEDAEALGAFFADCKGLPSAAEVSARLKQVFECRYERATLIQAYSRQQAKQATDANSTRIKMNPSEFLDYNCNYSGAKDWQDRQQNKAILVGTQNGFPER